MVKRLSQIGNKYMLAPIFFAVICIIWLSCGNGGEKIILNDGSRVNTQTLSNVSFVPDTTVNLILSLNKEESLNRFIPVESKLVLTEYIRESPVIIFLNKGKNEFLLAYQHEGGSKNCFSAFEIGYVKDLKQKTGIKTTYEHFTTESGVKLGDSLNKVLAIKGSQYSIISDSSIVYEISNHEDSNFLKFHNMPAYSFQCFLTSNRITRIQYGFVQP